MEAPEPRTLPDGRVIHPPNYSDGGLQYKRYGLRAAPWVDSYHYLLRAPWSAVLGLGFAAYLGLNLLFAGLYALEPGCVSGAEGFLDLISFSVQTFATIGYGALTPGTPHAHLVVLIESFVGLSFTAVGAGLMFAKFSRPSARVAFSEVMVVHERDGVPCLLFRVANERRNEVLEARLHVSVILDEITAEGDHLRRFRALELERSFSPLFMLGWTAIHRIDERSPLYGIEQGVVPIGGVVVIFTGTDDTFSQPVHARRFYGPQHVRVGYRFVDMMEHHDWGLELHHDKLSEIEPA
ncbi:MAG: hypothetical protein H6740_08115 [Alphaproteobacteria bacterium]|nr:hypothetical protein [Alphaproteobacteria bacterium]